jgi:hypothetical protein
MLFRKTTTSFQPCATNFNSENSFYFFLPTATERNLEKREAGVIRMKTDDLRDKFKIPLSLWGFLYH